MYNVNFNTPVCVHFIGIGGAGMCGIAEVMCNQGFTVSGSDQQASAVTARLESLGVRFGTGHEAGRVRGAGVVVVSSAIAADNPEVEITKVMWDAYKRISSTRNNTYPEVIALLKKQMEEGMLVMNYTGHGSAITLSHEFVLNLEDFQQTQGTCLPLWVTAACDIMPFDGASDNIGEAAVLNASGGALAFYGTTRTVYATQNLQMNRYFMKYLFGCDANGRRYRVGDAVCLAKNAIISDDREGGNRENKLHYALLGDPALTFGAPTNRVVLDSINGIAVEDGGTLSARPEAVVAWTGNRPTGFVRRLGIWDILLPRAPRDLMLHFHGPCIVWLEGANGSTVQRFNGSTIHRRAYGV